MKIELSDVEMSIILTGLDAGIIECQIPDPDEDELVKNLWLKFGGEPYWEPGYYDRLDLCEEE